MEVNKSVLAADTITKAIDTAAAEYKSRDAMRFRENPGGPYSGVITYEQLAPRTRILATSLAQALEIRPGQNVGFISENRPEYNMGDIALLFAGATPWGLYDYDVKNAEIVEYKLQDSGTDTMFVSPAFFEAMRGIVRSGRTPLKRLILMSLPYESVPLQSNEFLFSDLLEKGIHDERLIAERQRDVTPDTTSRIIYTSGTTGRPKGVMLTHKNLVSNIHDGGAVLMVSEYGRMISYLPEAHSFQGFLSYLALLGGLSLWYSHKKTLVDDIKFVRPHFLPGVPLVFKRFADGMREKVLHLTKGKIDIADDYSGHPVKRYIRRNVLGPLVAKKAGLDCVDIIVSGSAKLDQEHARSLENLGLIVHEGYGISETSPAICLETAAARRRGSVGRPLPNVKVRILSLETDESGRRKEMPAGNPGEICVRGPNVFKGYYNDEQKTAEAKKDGEYMTGDLGHLDADGFLFVHGRAGLQVKMNNGEFVDLDHLSADILRNTILIQSAVVDAEAADYAVAVVSLAWEPETLQQIAASLGVEYPGNPHDFAKNEKVIAAIKNEIQNNGAAFGRAGKPSTTKKFLYVAPMSPETGEITSTMKLRVKNVIKKYREQIGELRTSDETFRVYIP